MSEVTVTDVVEVAQVVEADANILSNNNLQTQEVERPLCNVVDSCMPTVGMSFKIAKAVKTFYRQYGISKGFDIKTRNSKKGHDQQQRYFILACSREGKHVSSVPDSVHPQSTTKIECPAKVTVSMKDGQWYIMSVNDTHCHSLSPTKSRLFCGNKKINLQVQRKLQINDEAGVLVNKSYRLIVCDAKGHENLPFVEKDVRNFVDRERRSLGKDGDGKALLAYFARMSECNRVFFYEIDLDDDFCVRNVFWADARSRAAYEYFGDIVSFDTTYLTNKYDMPFAPFVGVNHHGQSILLGCGLLCSEDTESFVWLFETWLRCMSQKLVTDQCKAMQNAIAIVFPEATHRWCLWHITKKLLEKLKGYKEYKIIKSSLARTIYDSITIEEFERDWKSIIDRFDLSNNDWLGNLFVERHRWVLGYLKCFFWAGMSTTQRSESMNAFFDGYINSTTTLQHFVRQYDIALQDKVEKEHNAEFRSLTTTIPCGSESMIERQFQREYTHAKFQEVQAEFQGKMNCFVVNKVAVDQTILYDVMEEKMIAEKSREVIYSVKYARDFHDISCTCCLFEFKGIVCRHALLVLGIERVKTIPSKFILTRWGKNIRRRQAYIKTSYDPKWLQPRMERFDALCKNFYNVAELAAESQERTDVLSETLDSMIDKMSHLPYMDAGHCEVRVHNVVDISLHTSETPNSSQTNVEIHSPHHVPRKGRPQTNRKKSTLEKVAMKKRVVTKRKGHVCWGFMAKFQIFKAIRRKTNPIPGSPITMNH